MTLDADGQTQLRIMEHTYGVENGVPDESMCWSTQESLVLNANFVR